MQKTFTRTNKKRGKRLFTQCELKPDGGITLFALRSCPALHADLGATRVTAEVAEEVVSGPAELVAVRPVVVGVAAEAEPILQAEDPSVVAVRLPLFTRVQHGGEEDALNQLTWRSAGENFIL